MATYCMTDIHGDFESYRRMLELIEFSDDDELYVLGDVIDRHPGGVEILLDIMERFNVHLIKGNHEDMCYKALAENNREYWSMWVQNGGRCTRAALLYREASIKDKVLSFIQSLPTFLEIEVGGRHFHLVHAAPAEYPFERMWFRVDKEEPQLIPGATVVVGHTPTPYLSGDPYGPGEILHDEGIIYIDCGCGSSYNNRRLGCLRLDDLQEFYIKCVPEDDDPDLDEKIKCAGSEFIEKHIGALKNLAKGSDDCDE